MGPVVSDVGARDRSRRASTPPLAQGARCWPAAEAYTDGRAGGGYFVAPTVLELGRADAAVARGTVRPGAAVRRAADADEAFALANDSDFGLSAAVFTHDLTRALQAVDDLDVGVLHINSESAGADPHVPFGGAKQSGFGPEGAGRRRAGVLHPHHHGLPARRSGP